MSRWRASVGIVSALLAGAGIGAGALWAITGPLAPEDLQVGPWASLMDIGEESQNPYTRARVALYGIWGLPAREVLYFTAGTDDGGRPLDRRCRYDVRGTVPPARWWSLTAYRDGFYIANRADRYSWSSSTLPVAPGGRWSVILSAAGEEANGLALGNAEGKLQLSFRLYQPVPALVADRRKAPLPSIRRIGCAPGA